MKTFEYWLQLVTEGLIHTHNIIQYHDLLLSKLKLLGMKVELNITNKLVFNIILDNPTQNQIDIINHECIDFYGYYPSRVKFLIKNEVKYNAWSNFLDSKIKYEDLSYIQITYEAKYNDKLYSSENECPNKLYHLTPSENVSSIIKIGLYPKDKTRFTSYTSRIFVFTDINKYVLLVKALKESDIKNNIKERPYSLLEINTDNNLILHKDPNYSDGFYTYDNIAPKQIKVIKENI